MNKKLLFNCLLIISMTFLSISSFAQPSDGCDCELNIDPVCVVDDMGYVFAVPNSCLAECIGYWVTDINCLGDDQVDLCGCDFVIEPVCVIIGDNIISYPNACMAACLGYPIVDGNCEWVDTDEIENEDDEEDDDNPGGDDDSPDVINPYINTLVAYPNPSDGAMQITIDMSAETAIILEVLDESGTQLMHEKLTVGLGLNKISLNTSLYESGVYVYRISIPGVDPVMKKFIVR